VVGFELLHWFDMVEKSRPLSMEEINLIEFLVAPVAVLSSSLAVEVACNTVIVGLPTLPLVACEVVDLQSDIVISSATLRWSWMRWLSSSGC
jgi:hypothetical protein